MKQISKIVPVAFVLASLILAFLVGCVTTDAYTTVGEGISSRAKNYKTIVAYSNLADNNMAHKMENAFLGEAAKYGIAGYAWLDMFPPLRKYETDEILEKLESMGVDMIVYLTLEDSDTNVGVGSTGYVVYTYSDSYALFNFKFSPLDMTDPILVTQISAKGDDDATWNMINAAAARRAMKEYATAAGIEPLPTPDGEKPN